MNYTIQAMAIIVVLAFIAGFGFSYGVFLAKPCRTQKHWLRDKLNNVLHIRHNIHHR